MSKANSKCPKYISWKKDPDSMAVDAFTVRWTNHYFDAFPPFSLILRVLHKIYTDKAQGVVVIPWWLTQPWFPMFMEMLHSNPIKLKSTPKLLISASRDAHPLS